MPTHSTCRCAATRKGVAVDPDAERIFPFHYGPIVINDGGEKRLILARYHCRQLGQAAFIDRKFPGLYNARRDSLEKYWKETFGNRAIFRAASLAAKAADFLLAFDTPAAAQGAAA